MIRYTVYGFFFLAAIIALLRAYAEDEISFTFLESPPYDLQQRLLEYESSPDLTRDDQ